jgi:hypothetical protein
MRPRTQRGPSPLSSWCTSTKERGGVKSRPFLLKKVAIVGGSPSWVHAPYQDESVEIWVHGNQIDRYKDKRITRIFEVHDDLSEHAPEYPKFLADIGKRLIVGEKFPIFADHISVFPYGQEVLKSFLTSTPAYMMAMAIMEGSQHISIYGVDMAVDNHEYFMQQPCMSAWIGYAMGNGIEVFIHESSPLMKSDYIEGRDYRFSKEKPKSEYLEMAEQHEAKMSECLDQIRQLEIKHATHSGAKQAYERLEKVDRARRSGQNISITQSAVIR